MKKVLLLGLVGLICFGGFQAQGQAVGCNDTVRWGAPLSFMSNKCCWTVLEGPTDCFYANYNQIDCNYDTLADHRFLSPWVEVPSFAATDSVVLIYATQVTCTAEYSVAITTDGVNYDTLRHRLVDAYQHDTIMLGAYAGQVIRIQFCHYGLNSSFDPYAGGCSYAADYNWQLLFSGLQWRSLVYPVATWTVPAKAYVGETTWLRASLAAGSSTGLIYTWHSSLMGQTLTGDTVGLTYTAGGVDTLTLITTNAYGSDTLTQTVTVVDCGGVVTAHPWLVDFSTDFDCWRNLGNADWGYSLGNNTLPLVYATGYSKHYILVSPAVQLPADSAGLRLYWRDKRYNISNQNYRVLVTTGEWDSLGGYDTVYQSTLGTSWTQRSVSLAAYAGQTVHIAFDVQRNNASGSLYLSDVKMYNALVPLGTLEAPAFAATGDTVHCTVHLTQGADSTLTYSWHSSLLDTTFTSTDSVLNLVYTAPGSETLTVTASNAHGTLELSKSYNVYTCNVVNTYPWEEDFSDAGGSYNVCWVIDGYSHNAPYSSYGGHDEETDVVRSFNNCMISSPSGGYMITPALAIPAGETNMTFMVEYVGGALDIRVSPTASTDTALFTDLLFTEPTSNYIKRRWINLGAYAGQTIRVALVTTNPNNQWVNRVWVGVDTLPYIGTKVSVPAKIHHDSTALCTVALYHGSTEGLHYTWTSAVGGIITTNALGDSAWVSYGAGFSSPEDTLTVVAVNAFGADTVQKPLHIIDCTPALALPWKETFADGLVCWYKPEGSKFVDVVPYNMSSYEYMRHLYLNVRYDTLGSWLMSKEIHIPTDTTLSPRLFWKVASSNGNYQHLYSVLVTTAVDYTDTANYTVLYTDSSTHVNFSNYDLRSVDLTPYAGQSIHVAFHNHGNHLPTSSVSLYIDDVEIRPSQVPVVSLSAPSATNSHTPVTFTATLVEGGSTGLTYTWHSTLMDSTMVTTAPVLTMAYTLGGTDTMMVIASNAYGADTATATVAVTDCTPIAALPWMEDFNSITAVSYNSANGKVPNCWNRYWNGSDAKYTPHVIGNYLNQTAIHTYTQSNNALLLQAGTSSGYDSVAMVESPAFDVSLNGQLLSFYYMHESASYGTLSVGYLQDGSFVSVAEMEPQATGRTDTVSLQAIPAGVNRFALHWKKTGTWYGVIVDNIRVFARDTLPTVRIQAPAQVFVGDPATFRAAMVNGLTDGLTYTWHSSLTGSTWSGTDEWNVTYSVGGYDTVSVVAANAYGADTAVAVVYVDSHPLPQVTLTAPASVYVGDSVSLSFTLNDCSTNGLAMTLHSSLLDTIITLNSTLITLNYTAGGTDTVTLIVSNAYGADTAVAYIYAVDCNNITLPYVETFEGVSPIPWNTRGQNSLPLCWQMSYNGTNANIHQPTVVSSYQYISNLPDQALLLMAGSSGYATWVQAELPVFGAPLSSLAIALDYRYESANAGTLTVGYVDDNLGYIPVDTLAPHAGSYTRDTVHFAGNVASNNGRIALRFAYNTSFYGVVVDNIEVISGNGIPTPLALTVDSVSASCASFSWLPVDSATAYVVSIEGVGDTLVSGTAVTFCGLNQESDYSVKVAAIVGTDTSLYTPNIPFSTLPYCASPVDVAVTADGVVTWQYATSGQLTPTGVQIVITDTASGAVVVTDTIYGNSYTLSGLYPYQTYSIVVTTLCGGVSSNSSDPVIVTTPPAACSEVRGDYNDTYNFLGYYDQYAFNQMIYPAQMLGSVDTLFGIALRVSTAAPYNSDRKVNVFIDHTTSTSLASAAVSVTGMTQTAHTADFNTADTGWTAILFDTPFVYNGVDNLIVTVVDVTGRSSNGLGIGMHSNQGDSYRYLLWLSSGETINPYSLNFTTSYNYYRAPDIQFLGGCTNERCVAPTVVVDSATTNALYLSWQRQGNESHYQVEYSVAGADSWMMADTTTATAYTLSGLAVGTLYQVRVGAVCDDSTVLYRTATVAGTLCGPVALPHYSDFATAPGHCWTSTGSYSENNGYSLNGHSFSNPNMLISPEVAGGLHAASVTIRARDYSSYDDARYAVGVSNADGSEVVWIDTVDFTDYNSFEDATVYLNSYTGTNNHVAIAGILSYTLVRSVSIDPLVGCLPVQRAWVNRIADTSATLHWIPEQTGDQFLVYLGDSLMITTTDTFFTFTGLVASTAYTARVVEQCSDGGLSVPVSVDFTTACTPLALPWSEDFTGITIGEMPSCWTTHLTRRYVTLAQVAWPDSWYLGSCRYLHLKSEAGTAADPDTSCKNYAATPLLNVGNHGAVVTIAAQGNYGSLLQVGVMTDPSDPSTFVPALEVPLHPNGFNCSNFVTYQFSTDTLGMLPDVWAVAFHWKGVSVSMVGEVSVDPIIVPTHTLSLSVNDTTMGSVTGGGTYEEGSNVTIAATPNEGYHFVMWNDSVTAPVRTIRVETDTLFTAFFAPDQHTVTVASSDEGACRTYGSGTYDHGDTIEIGYVALDTVTEGGHWIILGWDDGITDNPRQVVVTQDTVFTVRCQWMEGVGIGETEDKSYELRVYPNPAHGAVTVKVSNPATLTVLDLAGRVVVAPQSLSSSVTLPLTDLPSGTYFLRVTTEEGTAVKKLIVK